MRKLKLTKTVADTAAPEANDYEIRDTTVPGFLLKVTPAGRKMFMVAYTAANGQRRKPAIGRYGAITVEQARTIAQDWLAEVRRGGTSAASPSMPLRKSTGRVAISTFDGEAGPITAASSARPARRDRALIRAASDLHRNTVDDHRTRLCLVG